MVPGRTLYHRFIKKEKEKKKTKKKERKERKEGESSP